MAYHRVQYTDKSYFSVCGSANKLINPSNAIYCSTKLLSTSIGNHCKRPFVQSGCYFTLRESHYKSLFGVYILKMCIKTDLWNQISSRRTTIISVSFHNLFKLSCTSSKSPLPWQETEKKTSNINSTWLWPSTMCPELPFTWLQTSKWQLMTSKSQVCMNNSSCYVYKRRARYAI